MGDDLADNLVFGIFGLMAAVAAVVTWIKWFHAARRLRAIDRTPTTPLARAIEGRIEAQGWADEPAEPITSPLDGTRCAWMSVAVHATRGSGSSRQVQELLTLARGDELHFHDESGRACVALQGARMELPVTIERAWPSASSVHENLRSMLPPRALLELSGFEIEYSEQRICPGDAVHVTGWARPRRGSAAYRERETLVRFEAAPGQPLIVARGSEAELLTHHGTDAWALLVVGIFTGSVATLLFWAWLFWQPFR